MNGSRLLRSLAVFLLLATVFSGLVGIASASGDPAVFVPTPKIGDSAYYTIKEVIDDPGVAQGQVPFNWVRMSWQDEAVEPDATASPQPLKVLKFHLMFRQGSEYEQEIITNAFYDAATGEAEFDQIQYGSQVLTQEATCLAGNCVTNREYADTYVRINSRLGFLGPCGVYTEVHGAKELPHIMEVPGFCRDFRVQGAKATTTYELAKHTTWNDRDAVVYESTDLHPFRITYGEGIPFPVNIEVPFSEYIVEAYALGRHYELELHGFQIGQNAYPLRAPRVLGEPLPLVPRVAELQIDETGLSGFTLGRAYEAAMADAQPPRLSDFMAQPDAYIVGAWKNILLDENGQERQLWNVYASDGQRALGKVVELQSPTLLLGAPISVSAVNQYIVSDPTYEITGPFPSKSRLPAELPLVASALQRSTQYPGVSTPNVWGFYTDCFDEACTDVIVGLRTGEEQVPYHDAPTLGATIAPRFYQNTVFFDDHGFQIHTWRMDVDQSPGLVPVAPVAPSIPRNDDGVQADAVWLPPGPAAAASMGFLAALGALIYYFWPNLKLVALGLFSRIRDDKVLDHPTRNRVYQKIQRDPGIHFQALASEVSLGHSTIAHHVRKLREAGLITSTESGGRTCFFAKGSMDAQDAKTLALLRSKSTAAVFTAIVGSPGLSAGAVQALTGLSSATVSYHLAKLRTAGLVSAGRNLRPTAQGSAIRDMV